MRLESKWNTTFRGFLVENFRQQQIVWKGSPVFPVAIFQTKIRKAIFDISFRPPRPFFGKWNYFVQTGNAIPGRDQPVLNFAYRLPKPWADRFANVDGKQPMFDFTMGEEYCSLYLLLAWMTS